MMKKYILIITILMLIKTAYCSENIINTEYGNNFVKVRVLAFTDFHGNLSDKNSGAAYMASALNELRKENTNNITVAAGDLIGGSPLLSAFFDDEPTIEAMSKMGLAVSSVGNHEFDKGKAELLRMQYGGCNQLTGCKANHPFQGAKFKYLSANVIDKSNNKPLFPEYYIKTFEGIPIAFIGIVLKNTPMVSRPNGTNGLIFKDEVKTANRIAGELKRNGVKAIGLLIHEGGKQSENSPVNINGCYKLTGNIINIVNKLDPEIDFVIAGHEHTPFNCIINNKVVTSSQSHGALITKVDLILDKETKDVIKINAENIAVNRENYAEDSSVAKLINSYQKIANPKIKRIVGRLEADLIKSVDSSGESSLGNVITDAQLYAAAAPENGGADIAFINNGGIRSDLKKGKVTYSDLYGVQPFSNPIIIKSFTGAQIKEILEQQWNNPKPQKLSSSCNLEYTWDNTKNKGDKILPDSIKINGKKIKMDGVYRVAANAFLAFGGDNFYAFKQGKHIYYGPADIDAFEKYFLAKRVIKLPLKKRVTEINGENFL